MGARVEGKQKKKSNKANVTSKFGSKRKLSRMGKKVKKGKAGPNTEFITRSSALRKLQITLKDFRRLCILKGVYPRVPSKALAGDDKVYYDIKDISYIMHEPLLHKFREFKSFMKKIRKAAGRNQITEARDKNELKPKITLDHLVKERYPRFIDALRDLDDPLCMIHLFAALPSTGRITTEHTSSCAALCREWNYYVSKARCLRKVFVSVKGIYYQAEIMGEAITWLVPHAFTQAMPREVDFRVMLTFLEFYEVYMKFVLFKLYHMQGLQYPPVVDTAREAEGCCLLAIQGEDQLPLPALPAAPKGKKTAKVDEKLQAKVSKVLQQMDEVEEEEGDEQELGQALVGPLSSAFADLQGNSEGDLERKTFDSSLEGSARASRIFEGLVFFLNREVPRGWLQFCVVSFGGAVGWQGAGSPLSIDDARITHHIVDRPMQAQSPHSREYVQPQWIFDSINAQLRLPTRAYAPAAKLPPHLSPFVDDEKEGYMPQYREEIRKLQGKPVAAKEEAGNQKDDDGDEEDEEHSMDESASSEDEEELAEVPPSKQADNKKGPKAIVFQAKKEKVSEVSCLDQLPCVLFVFFIRSKGNRRPERLQLCAHRKVPA